MAAKVACGRLCIDFIHLRVPPLAFSVHQNLQSWRCLSVSSGPPHQPSMIPPKKPSGVFLKFMEIKGTELKRKHPDASLGERAKLCSVMWRDLDPQEKGKLRIAASEELQEYKEKYMKFLEDMSDQERENFLLQKKSKRKAKAERALKKEIRKYGKPKLPPNAFMLFVRSSRLERGNKPVTIFVKGLVEDWKRMPQDEKEIYLDDARMERDKYLQEMKEWEDRMKELGREDLIRKGSQTKPKKVTATKAKKVATKKPQIKATSAKSGTQKSSTAKSKQTTKKTPAPSKKKVVKKRVTSEE